MAPSGRQRSHRGCGAQELAEPVADPVLEGARDRIERVVELGVFDNHGGLCRDTFEALEQRIEAGIARSRAFCRSLYIGRWLGYRC